MKREDFFKVAVAIFLCEMAGVIGSLFTSQSIPTWYATLERPELAPPNWVFGPVWTTLFALMGISAFLIYQKGTKQRAVRNALIIFCVQLALNTLWSILFFGLQNPGLAFAEIILLWLAIMVTIISFAKISKPAAWLLLPYILWVSFAVYLNYSFWTLNS